ncbi:hypothetical protein B9Z19DRAFT_1154049 [Tuber borchii]|uniref:CCR4-NOT transcription complex subunit 1 domain-containing protein n=1 Tax=Tuber borchii TaxID=42251 RepID=A0A2T6ZIS5_TUBBO|nr:hypothetical protein B9Z19DRAFT_1154049 [Tuber borchii]
MDRTIMEIIGSVVEKSATIASISTSQLIQKDFAREGDEGKIKQLLFVNANIDIVCQIIEKAIQERAIPDIDDGLNQASQLKKPHWELRTNRPFVSPGVSQVALHLSDQLRLKPGGLSPQQLSMYEDFNRMARVPNLESGRNSFESPFPSNFLPSASTVVEPPQAQQRAYQQSPGVSDAGQKEIQSKISALLSKVRKLAKKECREQRLKDLHAEHPLFQFIETIPSNASLAQPNMPCLKDTICTTIASSVYLILYTDTQNQMELEALGFLLQNVCELSLLTAKDVVMWLSQGQGDEIFNVPVTVMLLKTQLFALSHLDTIS